MKKLIGFLMSAVFLWQSGFSQTIVGGQQVITLPVDPWATTQALLSLPSNYDSTSTETYALIIWLHGVGQAGTNISGLLSDQGGLPYRISQGFIPQAISPVDGKLYKFIVVSPQAPSWSYQYQQIQFILPGILAKYRVDTTRIYITGLSAGGNGALTCITDNATFCGKIAAVSVMSAASITSTEAAAMKNVDINHLPFWDICGTADPNGFYPPNVAYVDTVWKNNPNPTPDSTWLYNVGHSSWFEGYDPNWKGRSGHSNGLNMYQWFLLWQRGVTIPWGPGVTSTAPPPKPTAKTTVNSISITLPIDLTVLNASPSTPPSGGTITSYQWSVLSGPSTYAFTSTTGAITTLTSLGAGTYKVLLTVTSNLGAVAYDTVSVVVNPSLHTPPIAVVTPSSVTLTLPSNSTTLNGASSTDVGATITNYTWAYVSGPSASAYSLANGTTSEATLSQLISGTYIFSLTIKDNLGATATAYDTIVVDSPPPANTPPVAATTKNSITVTLPLDTTLLNGSPSAPPTGGTITGYAWTVLSGPAGSTLSNSTSAIATLKSLKVGTYKVVLTVTDSQGLTAEDTVSVTVDSAASVVTSTCNGKRIILAQQGDNGITLDGVGFNYQPGDTLVIPVTGTNYTWLDFTDIYGTATCPVVMTNGGGQVVATTRFNCANCRYVHMTGTGTTGVQYGFLLQNTSQVSAGIDISGRSSYVEMDHFSIHNLDYGIWVKQDQGCIDSLNYPNWTIDHISIHDNRIVGTYDEGMYLGTTDPNGTRIVTCNGVQPNPLPKPLYLSNISVYNNYIDSTGRSGIQLSDAETGDNEIYNNNINNSGLQLNNQQGNGISLGGYTQANVHNNVITNSYTMGIFALGAGVIDIYDNTIALSGHLEGGAPQSASIMMDTRPTSPADSTHFTISNNILGTNTDFNIRVYASYPTYAYANVICNNKSAAGVPATLNVVSGVHYTNNCSGAPPGNVSPVARAGGRDTLTLPTSQIQLNGLGSTDADSKIVSYLWTYISGPGSPKLANATTAQPTLSNLGVGVYQYLLTVADSLGATGLDTLTVVVLPAPSATPTLVANAGGNATLVQPQDSASLNGTGSYGQGGVTITAYQWKLLSGPAGSSLKSATSVVASLTNTASAGAYVVVLTVTGSNGKTASDTATITVIPDNVLPTAIISNTDTVLNLPVTGFVLDGSKSFAPPNTTLASYQWTQVSGPSTATLATATAATTGVSGLVAGIYVFKLTVADVQGEPASATITIHVKSSTTTPPRPPVANPGSTITIQLPTNSTNLNGSASTDPNGSRIVSYQWSVVSGPAGYTLGQASTVQPVLANLVAGTYVVNLTVTDSLGLSGSATVDVIVLAAAPTNTPPTASAGSDVTLHLPVDSTVLSAAGSTDPNGSRIVSYQWSVVSGPSGYSLTGSNSVQASLGSLVAGTYQVKVTVTDSLGLSGSATVTITVLAAVTQPTPPTANAGGNITLQLPQNGATLSGAASSDPNVGGSITSYQWTVISGPSGYTLTGQTTEQAGLSGLAAGTYKVALTVTDNLGLTGSDTVVVTELAGIPPVANAGGDVTLVLPQDSATLNGAASYGRGGAQIVSYQWTVISGPSQYVWNAETTAQASLASLSFGTYTVVLTVTDNDGLSASDTAVINVTVASQLPIAIISNTDTVITLPDTGFTLEGSASYAPSGQTIVAYQWLQLGGPTTAQLSTPTGATTAVGNLSAGSYLFELTVTATDGSQASVEIVIRVTDLGPASVRIYPNPVSSSLNVWLSPTISGNVTLYVYDVSGNLVMTNNVNKNGQVPEVESMNVSNLSTGVYFLRVQTQGEKVALKFLKTQ